MQNTENTSRDCDITRVLECIASGKPFDMNLNGPSPEGREYIKCIIKEYLKQIGKEKFYNLVCLCMEEIISNSVKANVKRAYFVENNLDINNHNDYEIGMKTFREQGIANCKDREFINKILFMGFYIKVTFKLENDIFYIITRNNSVISQEELERINKRLALFENKSPEEIFVNSIDTTEGAGLGIIMIKKIMSQVSTLPDCFSISANEIETITQLKISRN